MQGSIRGGGGGRDVDDNLPGDDIPPSTLWRDIDATQSKGWQNLSSARPLHFPKRDFPKDSRGGRANPTGGNCSHEIKSADMGITLVTQVAIVVLCCSQGSILLFDMCWGLTVRFGSFMCTLSVNDHRKRPTYIHSL